MLDARFTRPPLARDTVRFVGEPVAVVVADTAAHAVDAVELVVVEVEPLPVTSSVDDASASVVWELATADEQSVLGDADVVVRGRFVNQRIAAAPMEPDGAFALPDGDGVVLWASTQRVHTVRDAVAESLGLDPALVRVRAPQVGGGFGGKFEADARGGGRRRHRAPSRSAGPVGADASREPHGHAPRARPGAARRARRWTPTAGSVGSGPTCSVTRARTRWSARSIPNATLTVLAGTYNFERAGGRARSVTTNTTPTGAYRGAGRPEAAALLERLVDLAASELAVDPVELRRRNLDRRVPASQPHRRHLRRR